MVFFDQPEKLIASCLALLKTDFVLNSQRSNSYIIAGTTSSFLHFYYLLKSSVSF